MVTHEARHLIILPIRIMVEGVTKIDAEGLIAEARPTREVEEEEEAESETTQEITTATTTTETITIAVPAATVEGSWVKGEGGSVMKEDHVIGLATGGLDEAGVQVVHEADTEGEAAVAVSTVTEVVATLAKGRHAEIVRATMT